MAGCVYYFSFDNSLPVTVVDLQAPQIKMHCLNGLLHLNTQQNFELENLHGTNYHKIVTLPAADSNSYSIIAGLYGTVR